MQGELLELLFSHIFSVAVWLHISLACTVSQALAQRPMSGFLSHLLDESVAQIKCTGFAFQLCMQHLS